VVTRRLGGAQDHPDGLGMGNIRVRRPVSVLVEAAARQMAVVDEYRAACAEDRAEQSGSFVAALSAPGHAVFDGGLARSAN
jgi:hypothetical protein